MSPKIASSAALGTPYSALAGIIIAARQRKERH
jgi:hypothetical protein